MVMTPVSWTLEQCGVDLVGRWGRLRPGLCRKEAEAMAKKRYSPKVKFQVVLP